eukprot:scaffold77457_cov66-Phaeocystis_antarctica.AAC.7
MSRYTPPPNRSFMIRSTSEICAMLISSCCPSDLATSLRKSVTRISFYQTHEKKLTDTQRVIQMEGETPEILEALILLVKLGTLRRRLVLLEHEVAEDARAR